MHHGAGELDGLRVALGTLRRHHRAARVTQAECLGHLVERLAHRVVDGGAQHAVIAPAAHVHEHSVSAADQGNHRRRGEIGRTDLVGVHMALKVVHTHQRLVGSPGRALGERHAHHQRTHQARRVRDAHTVKVGPGQTLHAKALRRNVQAFVAHAADGLDVLAAGDLGNHAAEAGMEVDLACHHVGKQVALAVDDCCRRLIAGTFDSQDERALELRGGLGGLLRIVRLVHAQRHAGDVDRGFLNAGILGDGAQRLRIGGAADGRGADNALQRALHDDGVLAVGIVMRALADGMHAKRFVERLCADIGGANLQRARGSAQVAGIGSHAGNELARDAAAAPRRIGADLEDLHLPVDHHAAGIADQHVPARSGRSAIGAGGTRIGAFPACIRRPPGAIGARKLIGHQRGIPCVRAHDLGFHGRNMFGVRSVEWLVRDAVLVGAGVEHRRVVHGGALVAARRGVLHAGSKVFRVVLRQADALVLLGVGQARVHRKQKCRVVTLSIQRIGRARAPRVLQRQQKPAARGRPQLLGQQRARGGEQLRVLRKPVARQLQRVRRSAGRRFVDQFLGCRLGFHHTVRLKAMHARIIKRIADGVDLLAHGVGDHGQPAAHARGPRMPGHHVERRHAHQCGAKRLRRALGRGHGDAHARERPRAAADAHARQLAAPHADLAQQGVHPHEKLRVRRAMRRHLHRSHRLHRACRGVQTAQPDGDHLVRRIERQRICGFRHSAPLAFEYGSLYGRFR